MNFRPRIGLVAPLMLVIALVVSQVPLLAEAATKPPTGIPDGTDSPFGYRNDAIEVTFNGSGATLPGLGGHPDPATLRAFEQSEGLELEQFIERTNIFVYKLPMGTDPAVRIRALRSNPRVRSASVVAFARTAATPPPADTRQRAGASRFLVNDPYYPQQWNLPQIQASNGWDLVTGAYMIGIIDSGINPHEDLAIGGNVNFSADASTNDNYGHGTAMAGIAAAIGNNGKGIAGVTGPRNAQVYNIKVIDAVGGSDSVRVANAITWAADYGPYVLNASLNVSCTTGLLDAIYYAYARGRVVMGSTGNGNQSNFNNLCPAASIYAVAVGGTNGGGTATTDKRWCQPCGDPGPAGGGSNYGNPGVDVSAPSTWIYVTTSSGGYLNWSWAGTSGATAHVSGLVALMFYKFGRQAPSWFKDRLHQTAEKVGGYNYNWAPGQSAELGFGRINVYLALQ